MIGTIDTYVISVKVSCVYIACQKLFDYRVILHWAKSNTRSKTDKRNVRAVSIDDTFMRAVCGVSNQKLVKMIYNLPLPFLLARRCIGI